MGAIISVFPSSPRSSCGENEEVMERIRSLPRNGRRSNKKGILSLICGVENSILDKVLAFSHPFLDKVFCLVTPLFRQSLCLVTPLFRQSFCLVTPLFTQSFCLVTPQKTVHGRLKNGPHPNNNKKKKNNAFLSLICRLRRR